MNMNGGCNKVVDDLFFPELIFCSALYGMSNSLSGSLKSSNISKFNLLFIINDGVNCFDELTYEVDKNREWLWFCVSTYH